MKKIIYTALSFSPMLAMAQSLGNLPGLVTNIGGIIKQIIPLFFAIAILYFFWGLVQYIRSAGDADKAKEGRSIMIWGIVALAVMVSVYGIINWLQATTGIQGGNVTLPTVPGL